MSVETRNQPMIFVTGASRSGTTMLSRVLGNSETVLTLNELHFFGELLSIDGSGTQLPREEANQVVAMALARVARDYWVKAPTDQEWMTARRIVQGLRDADVNGDTLFACTMEEVLRESKADRICEQTPRNIYYAQHLLEVYPNARFVHVVRDPRAVLASQKDRHKIRRLGGDNVPLGEVVRLWLNYHPVSMIKLWRSATRVAQDLQDHDRMHIVRYEDLVSTPQQTLRGVCDFLAIDFKEEMMAVPHYGSSTVTHSESAGLSSAAVDKWQTVLNGAEIAYCESRTAQEREEFNYDNSRSQKPKVFGIIGMVVRFPIHAFGALLINPGRVITVLRAIFGRRA